MSETEKNIMNEIMLALSEAGCMIFRNNIGCYKTDEGRFIRYGVGGNGSSDIVGMDQNGKFLAVEVKTKKGKARKNQINFINQIRAHGGRAGIARSAEEALSIIFEGANL